MPKTETTPRRRYTRRAEELHDPQSLLQCLRMAMIWFVKLVTDPLTDIGAYGFSPFSASKALLPSPARKSAAK